MKIAVFGAGLMSWAAVHDYLAASDVESIEVFDINPDNLRRLAARFEGDARLTTTVCDVSDPAAAEKAMGPVDGALSAIHYSLNPMLTGIAIKCQTNLVDLGGNNDAVRSQLELDSHAKAAGVSIIPDCGLAPGFATMLVSWGEKHLEWARHVRIRVGGLPMNPRPPYFYERLFAVEGLINEYVEPPLLVREGRIIVGEPLGDIEIVDFADPVGRLEAFNTSGGLSTMGETWTNSADPKQSRFQTMDYRTLRLPGHAFAMQWMMHLGLFSSEKIQVGGGDDAIEISPRSITRKLIEENVPLCERDRAIVRVTFSEFEDAAAGRSRTLEIVDEYDSSTGFTAMARTTAWPATTISLMQCRGQIQRLGVVQQELAVDPDLFRSQIESKGIIIREY